MIDPVAGFALEHVIALAAGGGVLLGGLLLRNYGRRLERRTRARGHRQID